MATTPTTRTASTYNPNWIRTTLACALLAILLKVGLGIPFFTTFVALGIIYLTHIVFTEMQTGVTNTWTGMKLAGNMAIGVVIFLALRFLAAKVLGLYPIETYKTIDDSGGLYWILGGKDVSSWILWEVIFAFVAGGLAVTWAQERQRKLVGTIFVFSLVILSIQIALPNYASSWPDRNKVGNTLTDSGVMGAGAKGVWAFLFGRPAAKPTTTSTTAPATAPAAEAVYTNATVLRFDGFTPCDPPINFSFELDTQGDPVSLKFPGIEKPLHYSGKGRISAPEQRRSGPVRITSLDPQKQARVRIWEVITIRK